jgi:hypothetical protein
MPGVAGAAAIAGVATIASGFLASDAASKAAGAQGAQTAAALNQQRLQFEQTQRNLQPFIGAGQTALQGLEQGSTAQGLDQRLGDIFSGSSFQNLLGERTRAAQGGLAAAGLTRSGAGLQAIAGIPQGLGLELEQLLGNRQGTLAGLGQQTAAQLGGLSGNFAANQSSLLQNLGQTQAQGILGQGQADTARNQAFIQGIGQLAGAGFAQFGGVNQDVGLSDIGGTAIAQGATPSSPIATNTGTFQGPLFPVG